MSRYDDHVFASVDGRYRVVLTAGLLARMVRLCAASPRQETGGILAGSYSQDRRSAVVTLMTGPPSDSRSGRTWLIRGVAGLKDWLLDLWKRKVAHYLGEWHYHPDADPAPSSIDRAQLRAIAVSAQYACPEPFLVILGGDPPRDWTLSVTLFDGTTFIDLPELP
jgi:integrative and conjugative element protein (TIGR02256 family)